MLGARMPSLKVGRVRVELSPNPFVGREDLIQRLTINNACMEVKAGGNSISLWVDANQLAIDGLERDAKCKK